jgi:glutathione S-transferase
MRPWVLLRALNIPFEEQFHTFQSGYRQPAFLVFSPSGKVPCLYDSDKFLTIWDSLAIIEYLAEQHLGVWPADLAARAFARCATSEMHSGFNAIRDECSFNLGLNIELGTPSAALQRDIDRIATLFSEGLRAFGGPWLAGADFSAVDAFFAPIAARYQTYNIQTSGEVQAYLQRLWEHPAIQEWVREGRKESQREPFHEEDSIRGRAVSVVAEA